jgi:HTH-type transcriptional regulator / antitoxin HigA
MSTQQRSERKGSAMRVKPLRTSTDHKAALAEIERLWDAKPGTEEADLLEVLVVLVDAYERQHYPMLPPDPIEAIKFRMEQRGSSRKDLEELLGVSRGRVSEVLARKRQLSLSMIRSLTSKLDIPADVLIADGALVQMKTARKRRGPSAKLAKK